MDEHSQIWSLIPSINKKKEFLVEKKMEEYSQIWSNSIY